MIRSKCCNEPAIQVRSGKYYCSGFDGCGKWCELIKYTKITEEVIEQILIGETEEIARQIKEGEASGKPYGIDTRDWLRKALLALAEAEKSPQSISEPRATMVGPTPEVSHSNSIPPTVRERTPEQNKAILDHAVPLIEANRRLMERVVCDECIQEAPAHDALCSRSSGGEVLKGWDRQAQDVLGSNYPENMPIGERPVEPYSRRDHTHCWNQTSSPCGIPIEKHTQCCLCDTPVEPTAPVGGSWGKKAHMKWLSKAHTAKINGSEMTVLPYGYLETAVNEAIKNREREIAEGVEKIAHRVKMHPHEDMSVRRFADEVLSLINKQ